MQPLEAGAPTAIGPYRLLGRLGSGGMGRVYVGRSAGGRTVAVKAVHPHIALDEEFRARFRREVAAARKVGGAWTAPVLDADPDAPVPWAATGYVAGPSLAAAVAEVGPLPAHSVRALGAGLAEALAAVHALDLVHRDVKPSNVLLTLDGPLLIDFGIARATDSTASLTSTGVSVGSPGYMSPEQILGKGATGAADVFSLGAVLVYAATGQPPFPGTSSASLLYKVVHEEPELGSLEGELRELAARCLHKVPEERPSPGELARALAPGGAAALVAGGWLPGAVVERVSRSAVALLNLEVAVGAGELPSGPVEFSSPSVGVAEFARVPTQPGLPPPPPSPPSSPPAVPAGKVSLSVAATAAPAANGRGRKVSCTVALAVAAALVGVTVGSAFLFNLLPGGNSEKDSGSSDTAASTPTVTTAETPASGAIPASYLGTWEGDGIALGGALPMGTFRVTIHQAAVGQELGTFRQTDPAGGICADALVLRSVSKNLLVAQSVANADNRDVCTKGRHRVVLAPTGTTGSALQMTMTNADAGDPEAKLAKVK
ncbi:serine/threonine protein kinase [Actinobacteria bacterium OK074]|nr:serine/threonine protein kinase [Actinobacteria bacterium OK074]